MTTAKINLLDYDRNGLREVFAQLGEKPYRAEQVMKWIYHRHVTDFAAMTDVGKALREKLENAAEIVPPKIAVRERRRPMAPTSGCSAWTAATRSRPCSSRKRAAARCAFHRRSAAGSTASSARPARRASTAIFRPAEIIGQVFVAAKHLGNVPHHQRKLTNVVMMGMGEPLLNFDNVVRAMSVMRDDLGFGLANKRVTLSTAGLVPMIDKLGEVDDVSLAVSLHAPNDELRTELVPLNKKYPIDELLAACARYAARRAAHVDHVRIHDARRRQRQARARAPADQADAPAAGARST